MKSSLILYSACLIYFFVGPALAIEFDHDEHLIFLDEDPACFYCHKQDAKAIVPAKEECLECHEEDFYAAMTFPGTKTHGSFWSMNHRAPAKSRSIDCLACHGQEYCMECHTADFADEVGELGYKHD